MVPIGIALAETGLVSTPIGWGIAATGAAIAVGSMTYDKLQEKDTLDDACDKAMKTREEIDGYHGRQQRQLDELDEQSRVLE